MVEDASEPHATSIYKFGDQWPCIRRHPRPVTQSPLDHAAQPGGLQTQGHAQRFRERDDPRGPVHDLAPQGGPGLAGEVGHRCKAWQDRVARGVQDPALQRGRIRHAGSPPDPAANGALRAVVLLGDLGLRGLFVEQVLADGVSDDAELIVPVRGESGRSDRPAPAAVVTGRPVVAYADEVPDGFLDEYAGGAFPPGTPPDPIRLASRTRGRNAHLVGETPPALQHALCGIW